ncbi:MAG: FAD-dependent oxidoreductase [Firmicutes bacterium]|nr:FAD-dependent oxidoreductase [Bacillota bacterium]
MNSLWAETAKIDSFSPLLGDAKTEALIIGGGMAGVLCAFALQEAGVPYLLVEADRIGGGVSRNTTAKITSQHGFIYQKLRKSAGLEKAKMYLDANERALEQFRRLSVGIDCDFAEKDAYVYSLHDREAIENELLALRELNFAASFAEKIPLPLAIAGAVRFPRQVQFHPLKFLAKLSRRLNIREHTRVRELLPYTAVTERGDRISARHIIIATHFPFLNKHGMYFLKMYQHRSYVIALENAADVNGMYLEEKKDGLSFRNQGDCLLVGGGDHKTGKKGGDWQVLRDFTARAYPRAREQYAWAAQDCMTLDGVPYIGPYGGSAEGLYVATGFNKWGMTSSMVSAMLLTDLILGRKNAFAEVFSPQRSMIKPQLLVNGLAAVGNLLTPTAPRCPHLGCALKWNAAERSWDCPCHGSRFDGRGILLDNPATGNANPRRLHRRPLSKGGL